MSVSQDAFIDPSYAPAQAKSTGQPGENLGPHFIAKLAMLDDKIDDDGHLVRLQTGMMVSAEILTGRRRVMIYLYRLSPKLEGADMKGQIYQSLFLFIKSNRLATSIYEPNYFGENL